MIKSLFKKLLIIGILQNAKLFLLSEFSKENYNILFPYSRVKTPLGEVKIGEHQFEKLEKKDRKNLLLALKETLSEPDFIIKEEEKTIFGDFVPANLYERVFVIPENKNKTVQSVVVTIHDENDENVSISTHEKDLNNVLNKIKDLNQLLYIGPSVEALLQRLFPVTVEPTGKGNQAFLEIIITENNKKANTKNKGET